MGGNSYWTLLTVKDGERTVARSLNSILNQSVKPSLVCIVDDGSTDSTSEILERLRASTHIINIITLPNKGYDIRRIVNNWNTACEYVKNSGGDYDYLLISGDDAIFPSDYVARLEAEMEGDSKLVVASGNRGFEPSDYLSLPEGAGRLIRLSFSNK